MEEINEKMMKPLTQDFIESCRKESIPIGIKTKVKKSVCKAYDYTAHVIWNILPVVSMIRNYKIKSYLINDIIAGMTVSFMQLPQGMAYAVVADLPIETGMLMGCFPAFCYFIVGSSKHLSYGPIVVISLMIGSLMDGRFQSTEIMLDSANQSEVFTDLSSSTGATFFSEEAMIKEKLKFAAAITIISGITQLSMSICRLGVLIKLLSNSIVSAFSAGIGFIVTINQFKNLMGVSIPRYSGFLSVPKTLYDLCAQIPNCHYPELLLSLVTIVILYTVKTQINERFRGRLRIPIPIDLLMVMVITPISHALKLKENYNFKIVGHVSAGVSTPSLPDLSYANDYISDSISVGIVAFVYSISVALIISRKEGYEIDANQELFAYGLTGIVVSCLGCYTPAAAISRTSVLVGCGGKSQVGGLMAGVSMLIMIFFAGPLLYSLPLCVLSCIIIVALIKMMQEVYNFPKIWRICKYDGVAWLITFVAVMLTSVGLGLLIGVIVGIISVIMRIFRVKAVSLGILSNTNVFLDEDKYPGVTLPHGIVVVSFPSPIYYMNVGFFREEMDKKIKNMQKIKDYSNEKMEEKFHPKAIIDCSGVTFIDGMGAAALEQLYIDYKDEDISCFFSNVNEKVIAVLKASSAFNTLKYVMYLTTYEAMMAASSETTGNTHL